MTRSLRWLTTVGVLLLLTWRVPTAESQSLKQRIRALWQRKASKKNQASAVRERVRALRRKQRSVLAELERAQQHLDGTNLKLRRATRDLNATERQLQATDRQLKTAQARLTAHQQAFAQRLRAMYRSGRLDEVKILMGASNLSDFTRRVHFFHRIVERDADLTAHIKTARAQVETFRSLLVEKRERARQLRADIVQRQQQIRQERDQEKRLLVKIQRDRATYERYLAELEESSREIESLIRKLSRPKTSSGGRLVALSGRFIRPVSGRLTSRFGSRYHPIFRVRKMHTGVDLAAPSGATVRAAANGRVIFAGWKRGYGRTAVIDHGGGVATVYGHCSGLLVSTGANVRRGQAIARVGSTGVSTGPHLHFEMRRGGRPVNPLR
jgi:murein DD-endopeptidase MepM/ murein hydrolase activator NlpD